MKSFLVLVDVNGTIIEVKWCDPITMINEKKEKIQDVFEPKTREDILSALLSCINNQEERPFIENQRLMQDQSSLKLYFFRSNNGVYVFAFEQASIENSQIESQYQEIFDKLLAFIQSLDIGFGFKNPEATRFQFEEIQLLNNELVNTRRMLEKSNAQLNLLNKELNNRLVKDPLTGLVSRYQYRSEIEYRISQSRDPYGVFMFIDIDDFKSVNDTYGHGIGDRYLVEFANRLMAIPLPNSIKLRIAGDEFGLFIYGLKSVEDNDLELFWELIRTHVLGTSLTIDDHHLDISISVGMAIFGMDTKEVYEIIEFADFAMYCAKKDGKNRYIRFSRDEYNSRNK